ncbi:hypothetical protein HELRODRAFT_188933 [Helobdella robusta]|uniref:Peptidase M14 domain-containing protein n=1 Tax=Helobdella robusta TaxID=6412 RepID=T1FQH9_HELRO|nr:hypothetical protein HELRODRAFT_188933 [Helobdella robusta]ESN98860.1 hypothetical protein HELRODRAFT_188933 [Helobdella robusta]
MLKYFILSLLFCVALAEQSATHQLLHIYPENDVHLTFLESLRNKYDVWYAASDRYDILLPLPQVQSLQIELQDAGLTSKIFIEDINKIIDDERERLRVKAPGFDYEDFNNLTMCNQELDKIAAKCIPGFVCTIDSIGDSTEKRPIKRLKISRRDSKRKIVWLDATTHAREWLTTATLFKIVKHMQDNYNGDSLVKSLLDKYDWHFIPIVNPDGYDFTWTQNRMWRKNRRMNMKPRCPGVDLNRNADNAWGTTGSGEDECSEIYRGPKVASEPETQALKRQYNLLGQNVLEVINIHAYGQYWMTSYGHVNPVTKKCYEAPDEKETVRIANAAADAIQEVFNTTWKRGPTCTTMYIASGLLIDDAKDRSGIRYTAVPEVRGNGFVVPPSEITPSFKEIWAGVTASIKAIEDGPFFSDN